MNRNVTAMVFFGSVDLIFFDTDDEDDIFIEELLAKCLKIIIDTFHKHSTNFRLVAIIQLFTTKCVKSEISS
jgi:hypothetical protein